jgi:two-component system, OmpR family, aerobic respiration control sensor histidine kinase ArcB
MEVNSDLLKQIILNVPNFVFWKDKDLIYRGCNYNFAHSAGFRSPDEVIGKTDDEMLWSADSTRIYQAEDEQVLRTGLKILNKEVTIAIPNQIEKVLSISKVPLYDDNNNTIGVLGIYIDVTPYKELQSFLVKEKEAAECANKVKTEFLENMRHDIRTPLTGIVGFANLLKNEAECVKLKEYAVNIIESSYALLDLMNEVLEATKVSSGEVPVLIKKFQLYKKIQEVITLNQAKAKYKRIALTFDYDATIPPYVIGDAVRIHRIVLELVANALNFTEEGSVKLSVRLAKREQRNLVIKICVEDTGIGMPADKQQEIFVQFKRLTPSYRGIYKGAGLGLTIVNKFIDELDGEIYVESEPKKGTKFTCYIPLRESLTEDEFGCDNQRSQHTNKRCDMMSVYKDLPLTATRPGQSKVLLIEDDMLTTIVQQMILSNLNCDVDIANNGQSALKLCDRNKYDLIFMDIGLPDIDGCEITKRIRSKEAGKGNAVPIIALTAHIDSENEAYCLSAGMNMVLNKPLIDDKTKEILDAFIPSRKDNISS